MNTAAIQTHLTAMGTSARATALQLAVLSTEQKNTILLAMADAIDSHSSTIQSANANDITNGEAKKLAPAMLDRLRLTDERITAIAAAIRSVAALPDPVGETLSAWTPPSGIHIKKIRVPIGVIAIIYESRPNVTSDAATLCLKSGNATILRGGSEAIHSNRAIATILQTAGECVGLPAGAIQLVPFTDRESIPILAGMDTYIDLIIPRGGHGLIKTVVAAARVPVIKHYDGICHNYIHHAADLDMAKKITINAKCQRPGVCNALETLLVDEKIAATFIPDICAELTTAGVDIRGDEKTCEYFPAAQKATETDWQTEYLDLTLAIRVVADIDTAIDHINRYGSKHSDCIITADTAAAEKFIASVDSATVFHNASIRFHDGGEFGFGAEIGISTDKLHARGPMALPELTSYKYIIQGDGQVRV